MSQTASERAIEINSVSSSSAFLLATDETHWSQIGIATAPQLDHYLAVCDFVNLYKETFNIKPSWMNFDEMSTEEIIDELKKIESVKAFSEDVNNVTFQSAPVLETTEDTLHSVLPTHTEEKYKPFTYNPFANLKLVKK